jgi:hypothetical protein
MNQIWILILLGSNDGALATAEFFNKETCMEAKAQVDSYRGGANLRYNGICVPRTKVEKAQEK